MTQQQIAATIAYSLDAMGFTPAERARVALTFAQDLRLTGKRRERFLEQCQKFSERPSLPRVVAS
jgi:hypothetical protein